MPRAPSTENYVLGRGRVYFDRFSALGAKQGWIDLGNAPAFSVNISKETLAHYSSRSGVRAKDLEVLRELASSFQFTLEEFSPQNLALAFLGTVTAADQAASTAADQAVVAHLDKWVDLGKRKVSSVVVTGAGGSPPYTAAGVDPDYLVDADEGMIMALSSGAITEALPLLVDYAYAALPGFTIKSMQDAQVDGSLKFVGDPATGPAVIIEVWKGKLMPSGEIGLIGEDWAKFQLAFEVAKDEVGHADSPYFNATALDSGWD